MKRILTSSLLLFTCFGVIAFAHDWYHDRDERFRGEGWRGRLFAHVRMDLDYVQQHTWPGGSDRYRIDRTKHELDELQVKLEQRGYDEHELNDVIGALGGVVADNRMGPRERQMLNDDLKRLRDFRRNHEHWWG